MRCLIFNVGSFSIKWSLFDEELKLIDSSYQKKDYNIDWVLEKYGEKVEVIGHRVVHGGWKYFKPVVIDRSVLEYLKSVSYLAPLHNPQEVRVIERCLEKKPAVKNVAVFDTEFFKRLPKKARVYGIKKEISEKEGIRRFGFHGISHEFVCKKGAEKLGKKLKDLNLITIHLGAGCSMAAIEKGKAVDCSFGFTPEEGLLMGKRCGDIDSGIIFYLINKLGLNPKKVEEILNSESGLKGLCGEDDMRKIMKRVDKDEDFRFAYELFCYRAKKYLGAYLAVLKGKVEAIIFTGAIGFKCKRCRKDILEGIDNLINRCKVFSIKTDEAGAILEKIANISR